MSTKQVTVLVCCGQLICQFLQDNILEDVPLWAAGLTVVASKQCKPEHVYTVSSLVA
jgi:hypothetical protein